MQMRREKEALERRLEERSIIERDLRQEHGKLASALAAAHSAHERAMECVAERALGAEHSSPRKSVIFPIYKNIFWIKVSKKSLI